MGGDGSGGQERIRPLGREAAHPDVQEIYDQDLRAFGLVLNPTGVFAYRPEIMAAVRGMNRAVAREDIIPAALKSLICVRVATLVGCPFWVDINAAGSSNAGANDEKIADLPNYKTSQHYSEAERVALEVADAMSAGVVDISDELYARLRSHYDEAQCVAIAATGALENFRARFNRVFRIEPNSLYCPVPGHKAAGGE